MDRGVRDRPSISKLVVRLAEENRDWGYRRIRKSAERKNGERAAEFMPGETDFHAGMSLTVARHDFVHLLPYGSERQLKTSVHQTRR